MNFSVCICVYDKDNHKYLKEALESIYNQSVKPNQIVLVLDGPINQELETVINDYNLLISDEIDFDIIRLNKNKGHGEARKISIENAKHGLIALMDADDISRFNRFEKQIDIFQNNNELSIVGGQILEIDHASKKSISIRKVPVTDRNIKRNLTIRSPFNQMSVMFKKDDVIKAGNYKEFFHNEDYYLWARMFLEGFTFYNTPEILVDVRINESFYNRRGGWRYFNSERTLQRYMLTKNIIKYPRFICNVSIRFLLQVAFTDSMRSLFFKKFARKGLQSV
jgi:glycosyltransferase involved in cell wall biosynthesis